jgi:hypothetical protein
MVVDWAGLGCSGFYVLFRGLAIRQKAHPALSDLKFSPYLTIDSMLLPLDFKLGDKTEP